MFLYTYFLQLFIIWVKTWPSPSSASSDTFSSRTSKVCMENVRISVLRLKVCCCEYAILEVRIFWNLQLMVGHSSSVIWLFELRFSLFTYFCMILELLFCAVWSIKIVLCCPLPSTLKNGFAKKVIFNVKFN